MPDEHITYLDKVDLVLSTESFNEFDVFGLSASLDKNTQMSLASIEGLGTFAQTASETVMDERVLQDLL